VNPLNHDNIRRFIWRLYGVYGDYYYLLLLLLLGPGHIQPSTITTGQTTNRVHTNSAAQGGKDVHTYSSIILDKGRDVERHIIHSYP